MNDRSLAISADYADALLVARKAKNLLFLIALLMLLVQIGLFFIARYSDLIVTHAAAPVPSQVTTAPATAPASADAVADASEAPSIPPARDFLQYISGIVLFLIALLMLLVQIGLFFIARYSDLIVTHVAAPVPSQITTAPATAPASADAVADAPEVPSTPPARDFLQYISGIVLFLGTILPILLALVLLLIVNIMLVGRLIGLTSVTSAFIWCLLLMLLMFPWQIFFGASTDPFDFRLPGVLYTWNDLRAHARFDASNFHLAVVKWARFVAMPAVATILLMIVQIKSNRGLRQALGEAPVEDIQISV